MKKRILILGILILSFACENESPLREEEFNKDKAISEIKTAYSQWALASQNKDIPAMYRLSYPGGNFEGMTNVCIEDWDIGNVLYYKFSSLNVTYIDEESAEIEGIIDMLQGHPGSNYKSIFRSSAEFYEEKWTLDGMNAFHVNQLIEIY
jgi:hypothetical protein